MIDEGTLDRFRSPGSAPGGAPCHRPGPEALHHAGGASGGASTDRETILLVEDDAAVRSLARRVLERYGYRVVEADSGEEALRRFEARTEPIRLLLTDVVMPGLGGEELYERLLAERPGLAAVFMSGYPEDHLARPGAAEQRTAFLAKPFSPQQLLQTVRALLDTAPESPPGDG